MTLFNEQDLASFENMSEQQTKAYIDVAIKVCDTWQLTELEKAKLLRAPSLSDLKYWELKIVFSVEPVHLYLANSLFDIYDILHTIYCDNDKECCWLKTPNNKLNNLAPLSIMLMNNPDGFLYIKHVLQEELKDIANNLPVLPNTP